MEGRSAPRREAADDFRLVIDLVDEWYVQVEVSLPDGSVTVVLLAGGVGKRMGVRLSSYCS